jgi:hypothetical protein
MSADSRPDSLGDKFRRQVQESIRVKVAVLLDLEPQDRTYKDFFERLCERFRPPVSVPSSNGLGSNPRSRY